MSPAKRSAAIDSVKGVAMMGVLAQHGIPGPQVASVWGDLWIRQAVPVLLVLMSWNGAAALHRRGVTTTAGAYGNRYLSGRLWRLGLPAAFVWVVSLSLGLALGKANFGPLTAAGVLPLTGPGNYFIPAVIEFAFAFPFVYVAFQRSPVAATAVLALTDAGFEIFAGAARVGDTSAGRFIYTSCVLRFAVAIALGLWLARGSEQPQRRLLVAGLGAAGLLYLTALREGSVDLSWLVPGYGRSTNGAAALWAGALLLLLLRVLPDQSTRQLHPLERIGQASFHIFLVQIIYFGLVPHQSIPSFVLAAAVCCPLGVLMFQALPVARSPEPVLTSRDTRSE